MSLIVILICLGLQRYLDMPVPIIGYNWFKPYVSLLEKFFKNTPLWSGFAGVALVVLPVSLVAGLICWLTRHWILGLVHMLYAVAVLLYCLDARDYAKLLSGYLGKGDSATAHEQAEKFAGHALPKTEAAAHKALTEAVFTKSLHQVFSILFWFLLLGPMGAVLYYVLALLNKSDELKTFHKAGAQVLGIMDWVPVRLLGLSFALVGSFANVYKPWIKALQKTISKSNELGVTFGLAAIGIDGKKESLETIKGAIDLCFRSQVVWVVVLALVTVASYF